MPNGNTQGVQPRNNAEKTLIILDHCYDCCNVRVLPGEEKTPRTVICPKSCGCPSDQQKTLYDLLDAKLFRCRAGIELDYRLKELIRQAQI